MQSYDFEESIGWWLCGASRAYQRAMNQELAPEGVTFRQAQVLGQLSMKSELSQVELAETMGIEPPTLVRVLDRMERDGLIRRDESGTDRRKKSIRAEKQADAVWKKIVACSRRVRARASGGMSERDLEKLRELLSQVVANLESPIETKAPRRKKA